MGALTLHTQTQEFSVLQYLVAWKWKLRVELVLLPICFRRPENKRNHFPESRLLVMFPDAATPAESDHGRNQFNKAETSAAD